MKKTVKTLLVALMLFSIAACNDNDGNGGNTQSGLPIDDFPIPNCNGCFDQPTTDAAPTYAEDIMEGFMYVQSGTCDSGVKHQYLSNKPDVIYLGDSNNGNQILAEVDVFLDEDGMYRAHYREYENMTGLMDDIQYDEDSPSYKEKFLGGTWRMIGGVAHLDGLGMMSPEVIGDKHGVMMSFTRSFYGHDLGGRGVRMEYITSAEGLEPDCVELSGMGDFHDYRYYQWPSVYGLVVRDTTDGIVGPKVIDWSYKVFLEDNGSFWFSAQLNLVPEDGIDTSTLHDGEDGTWKLEGEKLILGDIGEMTINSSGEVEMTFYRGVKFKSEIMRNQFELEGVEMTLTKEDGYL